MIYIYRDKLLKKKNKPLRVCEAARKQKKELTRLYKKALVSYKSEAVDELEEHLKEMGLRYKREVPVTLALNRSRKNPELKTYFLDFYVPSLRLVIEVDGGYHNTDSQKKYDQRRDELIKKHRGWSTLRLPNELVLSENFCLLDYPELKPA